MRAAARPAASPRPVAGGADGVAGGGAAATAGVLSLQVLPFAAGAYAAAGCGSMTRAAVRGRAGDLGVIHLAALSGGVSLEDREEVARYQRAFDQASRGGAHPGGVRAAAAGHGQGTRGLAAGACCGLGAWLPEVQWAVA